MKKLLSIISLLALFFVFSGCPYESEVPIDNPSVKINPKLLGTWEARSNQDESFKITKKDEFSYSIEKSNKKSKDKETQKYLAFASIVGGATFLNLWENNPEASAKQYYLYKMDIATEGMLTLAEITENIDEHFATSDELKKFILSNMKNSYFYGKDETTYIRTGN